MDYKTIRIDIRERVGVITLDYPPYNSVSKRMIAELLEAFALLGADDEVRCIMLRAEGPDFSYGADSGDIKKDLGAASEITESYSVLGNRLVESRSITFSKAAAQSTAAAETTTFTARFSRFCWASVAFLLIKPQ